MDVVQMQMEDGTLQYRSLQANWEFTGAGSNEGHMRLHEDYGLWHDVLAVPSAPLWIPWVSGINPAPEQKVSVTLADGTLEEGASALFDWEAIGCDSDIVKYLVTPG